jgi:hypothetical protein
VLCSVVVTSLSACNVLIYHLLTFLKRTEIVTFLEAMDRLFLRLTLKCVDLNLK